MPRGGIKLMILIVFFQSVNFSPLKQIVYLWFLNDKAALVLMRFAVSVIDSVQSDPQDFNRGDTAMYDMDVMPM